MVEVILVILIIEVIIPLKIIIFIVLLKKKRQSKIREAKLSKVLLQTSLVVAVASISLEAVLVLKAECLSIQNVTQRAFEDNHYSFF